MMVRGKGVMLLISVLLLASWTPLVPAALDASDLSQTEGRATTTWSSSMTLTSDYTVAAGDTLVITAGATISFDDNVRLYVEGELDVTGPPQIPQPSLDLAMRLLTRASNSMPRVEAVAVSLSTLSSSIPNGASPSTTAIRR